VPENIYLKSLREQYETLKRSIAGLQTRASEAKRDMTPDEHRSVIEMGEKAEALFTQIEDLSEIEVRNAKVQAMADRVAGALAGGRGQPDGAGADDGADDGDGPDDGGEGGDGQFRQLGGARTRDRDPGFYTRGGQYSFVGDQYRASKMGETAAAERLLRHQRALIDQVRGGNTHLRDVLGAGATTFGAGLVPPVWLAEQFAPVMHRKLRVASVLRPVPWAGPFAWSIPVAGTVAKTSTVAEGVNTTETDPAYAILTVTPKPIMGYSEVSRQMLEASNPAVDAVIWGDLTGDFYDNAELECITALNGQSGVNTVTVSAGVLTTTDILNQRAGILDGIAAISDAPAGDADFFVGRTARWTTYLKFQDTVGRPLILAQAYSPQNAIGQGGATQGFRSPIQGTLENLEVVTSPTVAASTGFIINSQEHLFSISPPMEFQFEQPAGPALVRIGIWGYEAVTFGRRPKAVTKITYSGS
jgi:HK97 family phage major capsid protein